MGLDTRKALILLGILDKMGVNLSLTLVYPRGVYFSNVSTVGVHTKKA